MSLFAQFATDSQKETDGVAITFGANEDGSIPTFLLSRLGKSNKAYAKALEAATRPYRRQIELGTMDNAVAEGVVMTVFANTVLKGWSNIYDKDGSELVFNESNAIKLFTALPELYDSLSDSAKSAAMFRDETVEAEAKN